MAASALLNPPHEETQTLPALRLDVAVHAQADIEYRVESEEDRLASRMRHSTTACQFEEARNALVCANRNLVTFVVRKYRNCGIPDEDLIQDGMIGLIEAAERFRPEMGFRFSTYAMWWIRRAILTTVYEQRGLIRLPAPHARRLAELKGARERLRQQLGRTPTNAEIAAEMATEEEEVAALADQSPSTVSLDAPVRDEDGARLGDLIPGDDQPDPLTEVTRDAERAELRAAMSILTPREQEVLTLRYGLDARGSRRLDEAAREMRLSRERIRRIEILALQKLRRRMS